MNLRKVLVLAEPEVCFSSHSLRVMNIHSIKMNDCQKVVGHLDPAVGHSEDAFVLSGRSGFGSLLSLGHSSGKISRLYMKGPGGRGEVEVAVSGVIDQGKMDIGPHSPNLSPKKGLGNIGSIVRTAASVASTAARHAYAAASSSRHTDDEMLPLKCCLMSVSLPWETIAHDLLFKGTPPINL